MAFGRLFTAFDDLIRQGQQAGELLPGDPGRVRLLLLAAVLGIAAFVTSGSIDAGQTGTLITDAVALFAHGRPPLKVPLVSGCELESTCPTGKPVVLSS